AIVDASCQSIIKHRFSAKEGSKNNWGGIDGLIDVLGLLATGEEKYLPMIQEFARSKGPPDLRLNIDRPGLTSWWWGYTNLFLTEYYLATGDDYVLPAITEYSTKLAMGQSGVGTWGHGMAHPSAFGGRLHGPPSGYGAMNQVSLTCAISLVLAQKCGVDHPEVDAAVERSTTFYRWYVDKGTIPYGDHDPALFHDNNGKNSQAAIFFDLLGHEKGARFFSRMVLASYLEREKGHTGHFFSWLWGAPAAARGGEEAAACFTRNTRWFTELERRADGGAVHQSAFAREDRGKYQNWSTSGARLLQHCLPRRQLCITGKGGSCFPAITGAELQEVVAAAEFDPAPLSTAALLEALGSWSPVVRNQAAQELGGREQNVVAPLVAMLNSPNRYARYGACEALGYGGRGSIEAVDALVDRLRSDNDLTLRYYASRAFRKPRGRGADTGHALAQGAAADKAAVELLKLAATHDPEGDPSRKLHNQIASTLFYGGNAQRFVGHFPNGRGTEEVDRQLLIKAIQ
ncbi:MAG: DUF6288 domain-containing protein, partial [Pirellulales bacterium]